MSGWTVGLLVAGVAVAASGADMLTDFAGRFVARHRQPNVELSGPAASVEIDRIDIEPIGAGCALVRIETYGPNGHACAVDGVAQRDGPASLRFRSMQRAPGYPGPLCTMTIGRSRTDLTLSAPSEECALACGMRAGFDGRQFPLRRDR